jgi:hypothetical protein
VAVSTKASWIGLGALVLAVLGVSFGTAASQTPKAQTAKAETSRPDFTGVWGTYRDPSAPARGAQPPAAAGGARQASATPAARPPRGDVGDLPLTEEAKTKIAAYRALVSPTAAAPGVFCVGTGMPGSMSGSGGYQMEIIQRPEQITIIYEAYDEIRRVYLGSRILPPEDRIPDRNGVSSARWEGDVLVVEVTDLKEQVDQRYAHSDQAKIVERYHLEKDSAGRRVLVSDWTMTDPFYTKPLTSQKKWSEVPGGRIMPYGCPEQGWVEHLERLADPNAPKSDYK